MLKIPRINADGNPDAVFAILPFHSVANVNWPETFPDAPTVKFKIFHDGTYLYIRYFVDEQSSIAITTDDNGRVWEDSCVEFFIAPDDKGYYNFETNCIGTLLIGFRDDTRTAVHATAETLLTVERQPSLGREPFPETAGRGEWTLTLRIPATALFKHNLHSWSGLKAGVNFYKCADGLKRPHYLSWAPIDTPAPDFHRPDFFRPAIFEDLPISADAPTAAR